MNEDIFHLGVKALLCNEEGHVLLLKVNPEKLRGEKREYWDLPGGRVQKGQTVVATLQREVLEEIGVDSVEIIRPLGMVLSTIRIPIGEQESVGLILSVYICSIAPASEITLSNEHTSYAWFKPEAAGELLKIKYPEDFCKLVAQLSDGI